MGAKDSKPCCIAYEDASARVTEAELKRLRDAFRRASTLNGIITKQAFIKEVLGEGVPTKLAEHIFQACGGTQKGINFKDLLCGLVVLTRGQTEEKIRFIFCLYANDTGSHVTKDDMFKLLHACEGGIVSQPVANLFYGNEKVTFEEFRQWLQEHPDATSLSRWLLQESGSVTLSNDSETPTFYQTLAGVTHLEETDIVELEKRYWNLKGQSRTGKFDIETLLPLISPAIPLQLCEGFFNAFDENRDGHIDFKEMACGISAACRGPVTERQKFCFKIFDRDRDGLLSRLEIEKMIEALLLIRKENRISVELENDYLNYADAKELASEVLQQFDLNKDDAITLDEYLVWTVGHPLPLDFLNHLFQVCHVVLGLRPATKEDEGEIIRGWLEREERRGMQVGHYWYLVAMEWWRAWHEYINYQTPANETNIHLPINASLSSTLNGSLKRTKLIKKTSASEGNVACNTDDTSVVITSLTAFTGEEATPMTATSEGSNRNGVLSSVTSSVQQQLQQAIPGSPKKISNSSVLCVSNSDISRCSSTTASPNHSPRVLRKPANTQPIQLIPQRPGAIDNTSLIVPVTQKVTTLTGEGGKLKQNIVLTRGRDFELLPEPIWHALFQWYGGAPALPRQVILPKNREMPELELYPIYLRLLRHQIPPSRPAPNNWSGMVGGYGTTALGATGYNYTPQVPLVPKKYVAYTASFSRLLMLKQVFDFISIRLRIRPEDMRLWHYKDESNMTLLEEEYITLEELRFEDNEQILVEIRNKDQTWPEEMSLLANRMNRLDRRKQIPTERGATGLSNLGNTCFMNAALQCVSNTRPLTQYFTSNMHLYELNRINPHGMKGHIAKRYGDLVQELWSGASKTIHPLKMRCTIGKYAPRFNGFQQHDSQELLAFLLDGLHEDLNRVHDKPYAELKDSDGRPDVIVAQEAWENHILRNKSIIVDLFHGQLKSTVTCKVCSHESVRFDPFNYLSLPLPMESCIHVEVVVFRLDGRIPFKYGLRLNMDDKYRVIKQQLSHLCGIPSDELMLAEVVNAMIKTIPTDDQKIKTMIIGQLFAYEVPPPTSAQNACDEKLLNKELQMINQMQRVHTGSNLPQNKKLAMSEQNLDQSCFSSIENQMQSQNDQSEMDSLPSLSTSESNLNYACQQRNIPVMTSSLTSNSSQTDFADNFHGFVIAYHRKMIRQDVYFLSSQKLRVSLFGMPIVIPCHPLTTQQNLYQAVWVQVSRLLSPLPPSEANVPNHAQDCDDSLGYEYPFTLKAVQRDGMMCAWCPWYRFCRGCKIECCEMDFKLSTSFIAIDWDPTALHLRYQASQERVFLDHPSVEQTRRLQSEPIDLDTCLHAFTKEEELGEDEKYYCSKCKLHQLASKKLQLWRLPPILIIHLKRFQFLNGRWVKSQKIVKFPFKDFDPTNYLASIPRDTVVYQRENSEASDDSNENVHVNNKQTSEKVVGEKLKETSLLIMNSLPNGNATLVNGPSGDGNRDMMKLNEKNEEDNKLSIDIPQDFHQHRLQEQMNPFSLKYQLYAISCHSGILGGGHYVCYACNPNNRWYCYNDSSCKEVSLEQIDSDSAYMLFYERDGIDYESYMPNIEGKIPDMREIDDDLESDFRKHCCVQ